MVDAPIVVSQTIATETRDRPTAIGIRAPIRSVSRPASGAIATIIRVAGRNRTPACERRVAEDVLHVEGQEEELGHHREGDDQRDHVGADEVAAGEAA